MVSGGRAFGKWLGHEDGALINGITALIKEPTESKLALSHHMRAQPEGTIYEEAGAHQTPNLPKPRSWTCQLIEL